LVPLTPEPTVAGLPLSALFRAKGRLKARFQTLPALAFTIAPYLQIINYRGRFSRVGRI
jgi:hypothetical protein